MKKILKNSLFVIIVLFALFIIVLNLTGYKTARVVSDSMAPKIYKNALAIIKVNEYEELEENDIIAFVLEEKLVLHRIIELKDDEIITKGDANRVEDAPITYSDVVGVYKFSIPLIGLLFVSIYPYLILLLIVLLYLIILQLKKEFKKERE